MTSPPDKLFHDRLEHYSKPAPASAWSRIESGMDRKRNRHLWMKIAAGLVLIVATSVLLWQQIQRVSSGQLANGKEQTEVADELSLEDEQKQAEASSDTHRESSEGVQGTRSKGQSVRSRERMAVVDKLSHEDGQKQAEPSVDTHRKSSVVCEQTSVNNTQVIAETLVAEEPGHEITESAASSQEAKHPETDANVLHSPTVGTNITYTAEEVNAKFLKKDFPAKATLEKKNTSGFQKVIAVAMDFKYEDSPIGDLREKKNEWFSINTSPKKRELNK